MGRVIIGSIAAAVAMFIIGFIFFATPLYKLGTANLDNSQAAIVQQALAANLPDTGTYFVPGADTPEKTIMYGQGPIATIHYNIGGFPVADPTVLIGGFVFEFFIALLIGLALVTIGDRVHDFASRARLVVIFSIAVSAFTHLGEPIWYHHDWVHFIYLFVADALALSAAGLIIARWFLGGVRERAAAEAPRDV
jgi:hypothetical protein